MVDFGFALDPNNLRLSVLEGSGFGKYSEVRNGVCKEKMRQPPHQLRELSDLPEVPKV